MSEYDGTQNNPFAPEDGMVRCPRKCGDAIAIGRCAEMRSEDCGRCPGLQLEPPKPSIYPTGYAIRHPYTEACAKLGHHASSSGMACLSCGSGARSDRRTYTVPVCAYHRVSSTHLAQCPDGRSEARVRKNGCPWQGLRAPVLGKYFVVCLYRPEVPDDEP